MTKLRFGRLLAQLVFLQGQLLSYNIQVSFCGKKRIRFKNGNQIKLYNNIDVCLPSGFIECLMTLVVKITSWFHFHSKPSELNI